MNPTMNPTTNPTTDRRAAAATLASASLLAIAGFTALGSVFDYPQILDRPTGDILALYRAHRGAVSGWFLVLVGSAALLAPAGLFLARIAGGRTARWITGVAAAAAAVQVIGLSRWVLLVPRVSDDALVPAHTADAHRTFELLHTWLGTVLGETIGYALTATFTVLVAHALSGSVVPHRLSLVGYGCAALIATGVVIPLGVELASLTNFAGYVLWCLWLVAVAGVLWRRSSDVPAAPARIS